eukprot:GHRR01026149.1.p1 GENE.GHRR01026149.1~~GHRR01026149.1.p1  ORF type:complete len:119 (+),score=26.94 GHRR01026149.1:528-884(+)
MQGRVLLFSACHHNTAVAVQQHFVTLNRVVCIFADSVHPADAAGPVMLQGGLHTTSQLVHHLRVSVLHGYHFICFLFHRSIMITIMNTADCIHLKTPYTGMMQVLLFKYLLSNSPGTT